ncbi:lipopolysaccharide biosynthesis protein [Streptomyces sp. NBC_01190]|uniref:lipopolysaccharide biosynthesis protein n=1 Tax=Streptomyces sp. NBC_01190 TaxID=2903767 RepID=UPI00386C6D3D|nr:lipopolysaccharide biosynthesis protein [Streptomyces sp. NBC_01190]
MDTLDAVKKRRAQQRGGWWRGLPRWLPLPLGLWIGLLGGLGYGLLATPQYSATSYVMVVPQHSGDPSVTLGFAQAYGRIVTGSAVLAGAQATARTAADDLKDRVRAATSPDAPMISITGTADHGKAAAIIANAVAASLAATGNRDATATGVRLLVFAPAVAPASPSSPSVPLCAALGVSLGGLLGALVLLVRPRATPRVPPAAPVPTPSAAPHEPARSSV